MDKFILENSIANNIEDAWKEWIPVNHNRYLKYPDVGCFYESVGHCKCGNKIKFFYQIKNTKTGVIFPEKKYSEIGIGSICINQFIRGYKFPTYKKKKKICVVCKKDYIDNCMNCQKNILRGIIYCINLDCDHKINKNTIKKYNNKMCRSCNIFNRFV
jgi:hypothetical protein